MNDLILFLEWCITEALGKTHNNAVIQYKLEKLWHERADKANWNVPNKVIRLSAV